MKFAAELLADAFFRFTAPSAADEPASPTGLFAPSVAPNIEQPAAYTELKGVVDLALKLQDQHHALSGITSHRVDRLLTMNLALAALLSAWMQWAGQHLSCTVATYGRVLVSVALYLAGKSALHALIAIYARRRRVVSLDLVDVGLRRAAGHDGRQDLIDMLCHIRDAENESERSRAISVEHSMLSWHTSAVQIVVTMMIFIGATWAPFIQTESTTSTCQPRLTAVSIGPLPPAPILMSEHLIDGGSLPSPGESTPPATTTPGRTSDGGSSWPDAALE